MVSREFMIFMVGLCLLAGVGWVKNLVTLTNYNFEPPYKAEVIRTVAAIIVPAGAVIGWVEIKDEPIIKQQEGEQHGE